MLGHSGEPWNTHPGRWSEDEYLALGETLARVELVDGCLLVSPTPDVGHQQTMGRLLATLHGPAEAAGMTAVSYINVRVGQDRILNPDLVLLRGRPTDDLVVYSSEVVLVGEVKSVTSSTIDQVLKMRLYAEGGIEWYLLADPAGLRLFRLNGADYQLEASARDGRVLALERPLPVELASRWYW